MTGPTIAQLLNIADRADRGPLQPAEVARLREGIAQLAAREAPQRPVRGSGAVRTLQRLRQRVRALHAPMWRGGVEVCQECSGWDGFRCRGAVTPYPCQTVDAIRSRPEPAEARHSAQQPARGVRDVRGGDKAAQRRTGPREVAAA